MTGADAVEALGALASSLPARAGRVRLALDGPIARLTLDNPEASNAITVRMMVELAGAVAALEAWDGAALLVDAAPCGAFCAGGHLGEVRSALATPARGRTMSIAMTWVLDRLLVLPCVSVAVVDGPAIGGGAELLTACDHRVLGRDACVRFVHARLGVAPGWGGAARLVHHVGRRAALRLLSSAASLTAGEALELGLADRVCDDPNAGVEAWLAPVLAAPPQAVRAAKAQVAAAIAIRPEATPWRESDLFASVWSGPAHQRALKPG